MTWALAALGSMHLFLLGFVGRRLVAQAVHLALMAVVVLFGEGGVLVFFVGGGHPYCVAQSEVILSQQLMAEFAIPEADPEPIKEPVLQIQESTVQTEAPEGGYVLVIES